MTTIAAPVATAPSLVQACFGFLASTATLATAMAILAAL